MVTWRGFLYVVFVIDGFARRTVGWRVTPTRRTVLVLDALEQAPYDRLRMRHFAVWTDPERLIQYIVAHSYASRCCPCPRGPRPTLRVSGEPAPARTDSRQH